MSPQARDKTYAPEATVLDDWGKFLYGKESNVNSQFGEDGLLASLFGRIGTENRWCFECGASDGVWYSNTKALRDAGWSAVLIERDARMIADLRLAAANDMNSRVVAMEIDSNLPLDDVLAMSESPYDPDLGVIDVDGQDYWLWRDMAVSRPRVMVVEYCYRNRTAVVPKRGAPHRDAENQPQQAGLDAIRELGVEKGYRAVAATPCNLLFVREDVIKECDAGQ